MSNKKSLILVAALVIALVGCNKEKEEANVPVVGEQQEQQQAAVTAQQDTAAAQQNAATAQQNVTADMQQQAPEASVATTQEAPITPSTLVMSNETPNPDPAAAPVVPAAT